MKYLPVILGTDVNSYGVARAFYMEYGVKSLAIGQGKLFMTDNSMIVDVKVIKDLTAGENFVREMTALGEELLKKYDKLILIASSDFYAELAIRNAKALKKYFFLPFPDISLIDKLQNKKPFYEECWRFGVDIPETKIISKSDYKNVINTFGYPVVLKASNSIKYFELEFEGKKKAYILEREDDLKIALKKIYDSGYDDFMILQRFVPGDDSNMYVLNAYVNSKGKVTMMALGHSLMEDPTPELIGNYLAIVRADIPEIYHTYKRFLESIGYVGLANFDIKYDRGDGKYKVFEINLRQGRSSFFTTLSGASIAKAIVEDLMGIEKQEIDYPTKDFLWLGAEYDTILNYVAGEENRVVMKELYESGLAESTLHYDSDMNFMRKRNIKSYFSRYNERFKKYFVNKNDLEGFNADTRK